MTKKSGGGTSTTTEAPLLPLEPVEFPFYYEDYGEVAYNYDDQAYVDHDGGIPNVLPIINHRREQQQKSPFLPTPLPKTTSETLVTADPLPLTTMKVETTTTSTTTSTTTTTTTTSAPTTILGS